MKYRIFLLVFIFISCSHNKIPFSPYTDMIAIQENEVAVGYKLVLDDFEDGNFFDNLIGEWKTKVDTGEIGGSTATKSIVKGQNNSNGAIRLEYTLGPKISYRYVMLELVFSYPTNFNQKYNGIAFWLRGSGHKLRIMFRSDEVAGGNYDDYGYNIYSTSPGWKMYYITFEELSQMGWGGALDKNSVLNKLNHIQFKAASEISGEQGWFEIDDIAVAYLIAKK